MSIETQKSRTTTTSMPTVNRKAVLGLILFILAILLIACGNAGSEGPANSNTRAANLADFNPCKMLTSAELETIFGEPAVADDEPTTAGPIRSCTFNTDGGGKFFLLQLGPKSAIEVDPQAEGNAVIPDLGDEAVFSYGMLRVRLGEFVMQITTWHPSGQQEEALEIAQEIARLALPRLPS